MKLFRFIFGFLLVPTFMTLTVLWPLVMAAIFGGAVLLFICLTTGYLVMELLS